MEKQPCWRGSGGAENAANQFYAPAATWPAVLFRATIVAVVLPFAASGPGMAELTLSTAITPRAFSVF
jgi:hypothetical protein